MQKVRQVHSMLPDLGLYHLLLYSCRLRLWMVSEAPHFRFYFCSCRFSAKSLKVAPRFLAHCNPVVNFICGVVLGGYLMATLWIFPSNVFFFHVEFFSL